MVPTCDAVGMSIELPTPVSPLSRNRTGCQRPADRARTGRPLAGLAGCRSIEADNAPAVIDWLQRVEIHLVTLDIAMPGCSGLDLLAQIKQRWPETEVIMLTAMRDTTTAIQAMSLGAYSYLIKPIDGDDLVFQAKKALERRELCSIERRQYTRTLEKKVREQMRLLRHAHEETILRLVSASRYRDEETGGKHPAARASIASSSPKSWGGRPRQSRTSAWRRPCTTSARSRHPRRHPQEPGKLAKEEFEVMKTHAAIGARCSKAPQWPCCQMARDIALCHHERWDGSGYPRGSRWAIPESGSHPGHR